MMISLAFLIPLTVSAFSISETNSLAILRHHGMRPASPLTLYAKSDRDAYLAKLKELNAQAEEDRSFFTGGALDKMEQQAVKLASSPRLKTVKDLGWTQPVKRKGSTRPRHRAWGGEGELPIQLKPNYDESSPLCVEKWLTLEDFYAKVRDDGPAADTVFCALAGMSTKW